HRDEQDELEGAQLPERRTAHESRDDPEEHEDDERADDDLHGASSQGARTVRKETVRAGRPSSSRLTVPSRRGVHRGWTYESCSSTKLAPPSVPKVRATPAPHPAPP